jgi:hypothetical protein
MTPKEKAKELVDKFTFRREECDYYWNAKLCALIALNEIINAGPRYPNDVDWDDVGATHQYYYESQREEALNYWQEVKQEIEKL